MLCPPNRRDFLRRAGGAAVMTSAGSVAGPSLIAETNPPAGPWLRKTLKLPMVEVGNDYVSKFQAARDAGFEGIEPLVPLNAEKPRQEIQSIVDAAKQTGIVIDGTVGRYHWNVRHTDPDRQVRKQAAKKLRLGIRQTRMLGGDTMLLVPGHGNDGSPAEVTERAIGAIGNVLPLLEKQQVRLLIENVWNHFLYDHDGGEGQSAAPLAKFVDTFESPWVGVQFDIGNHWKYGDPADWIRTLGKRIVKLDIKGFSRKNDQFTHITEGDIDWPSVKTALREIGYRGWVAAEVAGGDAERLAQISANMDRALQCQES